MECDGWVEVEQPVPRRGGGGSGGWGGVFAGCRAPAARPLSCLRFLSSWVVSDERNKTCTHTAPAHWKTAALAATRKLIID